MKKNTLCLLILFSVSMLSFAKKEKFTTDEDRLKFEQGMMVKAEAYLHNAKQSQFIYTPPARTVLDTIYYNKRTLHLNINEEFAYFCLRQDDVDDVMSQLRNELGLSKRQKLEVTVDDLPLDKYVPLRYSSRKDKTRRAKQAKIPANVRNVSKAFVPESGLINKHIALWDSHGYYYNDAVNKWKWQRAPLFSTVEDLFTSAYVLPFLVPMLENAGANVYLPRERDIQTNEVIIDNTNELFSVQGSSSIYSKGYNDTVLLNQTSINPFQLGNACVLNKGAKATWQLAVPASGTYAVYVSYATLENSCDEAHYELHHSGGITRFDVNQTMGGGTWIYLGDFVFEKDTESFIVLTGDKKDIVTADAIKLGGGLGSVYRGDSLSGLPRYQEAARYYLQYAGVNDTLVFNRHDDINDYNDDFRSRARWVNFLRGGAYLEPWLTHGEHIDGFNIPIDLSVGLHTDAGHFANLDTTVGTLGIYSTYDVGKNRDFFYGKSRLANRDLCDLIQESMVNDIRSLYDDKWTKRELWDKMYSEATFATVPSVLLELHAHSNPRDMYYGLDPQFRFDVSRSIYKGMLHFLSTYYNYKAVVQPLAVNSFCINKVGTEWELSWLPTIDKLESTAVPTAYMVYHRVGDAGWDNGVLVNGTTSTFAIEDTLIHSYKVTAVNSGGESFPSVILPVCYKSDLSPTVMVIDGFTRVSAPAFLVSGDSVGLSPWIDEGVPYGLDIATIGAQYEYDQNVPWESDDLPGHGGSSFELVDKVFLGNDFDNALVHATAIAQCGYNVVSASAQAFELGALDLLSYDAVDLFFGEQKTDFDLKGKSRHAIYSSELMEQVSNYLSSDNARLMINGAHIGNDIYADNSLSSEREAFFAKNFGCTFVKQYDDKNNIVSSTVDSLSFYYNVNYNKTQYRVEHVDGLLPIDTKAKVLSTYSDEQGASVLYQPSYRVISAGFPFEAIMDEDTRLDVMKIWLDQLF